MPLNAESLNLRNDPRSVEDARRWVAQACRDLDRGDLTESAQLGVSELVTNALLHAEPPLTVRMRGTRDHPRVEVADGSPHPPEPTEPGSEDDRLSTFGRGLNIVAMCSTAWGADIEDAGKVVWFEPAAYPSADADLAGSVFSGPRVAGLAEQNPGVPLVPVVVLDTPVRAYREFLHHYRELRRELRLLSLAHSSEYPLARDLSELFTDFEYQMQGRLGVEQVEVAATSSAVAVDLQFVIPETASDVISQMLDLLDVADSFCHAQRLLSLARTPEQETFQRWFLGEFVRQVNGEDPTPWPDPTIQSRRLNR